MIKLQDILKYIKKKKLMNLNDYTFNKLKNLILSDLL